MEEFQYFTNYLRDDGVDVSSAFQALHKFLEIESSKPFIRTYLRRNEGLLGYLGQIEAVIPFDKLKSLAEEKLKASENFQAFHRFMQSKEIHYLYDRVLANRNVHSFIEYLKARQVYPERLVRILGDIFGLHFG